MEVETHTTDSQGRVSLPQGFANSTVTVEQVSEAEVRIRKALAVPPEGPPFREEISPPLSDRDRDAFLHLLDHPPAPAVALQRAVARAAQDG
jgi:hypothetical protein